ncbi:MAG: DUF2344 domain-containing protein [Anaerolineae bacterium]|nr:DUF2344 domain-containing protein [Anaerolineae bacterium]
MSQERSLYRMRIVFSKGEPVKYVGHLDLMRAWERMLRRARVPLAYSQGFNPHPRMTLAMPLPVGCTGEREELDILLTEPWAMEALLDCLRPAMPPGLEVIKACTVDLRAPARPSCIQRADYRVTLDGVSVDEVRRVVDGLLGQTAVEVEFRRKGYDLRPLIGGLAVDIQDDIVLLDMALLCDAQGRSGRPDVVVDALGLSEYLRSMHRRQIVFAA